MYANKNYFSFNQDTYGSTVKVYPYTLLDHHPTEVDIMVNNSSSRPPTRKDSFLLNFSLLRNKDTICALYMIR